MTAHWPGNTSHGAQLARTAGMRRPPAHERHHQARQGNNKAQIGQGTGSCTGGARPASVPPARCPVSSATSAATNCHQTGRDHLHITSVS